MRKRKTICLLLVFLIGISVIMSLQEEIASAAPAGEDIIIEAEGGFDGIAKLGAWSPVTVKTRSLNRNISGEIEVEVNSDQERKVIISKPVELPAGVEQEVHFEIPVVTAKKGIEIRLTENKKVRAAIEYKYKRLLPPDIMMIGVLSEDSDAFNWLNGNTVPVAVDSDMQEKFKIMIASGQLGPQSGSIIQIQNDYYQKYEAVVVPLTRNTFPELIQVMDGFDFLIISKYDTSLLSNTQVSVLEEWVESGGILITGTGLSWQKVYHGLPESLKPFSITGTEDVQTAGILEKFTGRDAEGINLKLAKGELGFEYMPENSDSDPDYQNKNFLSDNYVITGDGNNPIAIKYRKESGAIVVLTFDPTVEPFASWYSRAAFMENVFKSIDTVGKIKGRFYEYINGYYRKYSNYSFDFQKSLAANVPFDKVPPFRLMFVILGIYILLAGPALYIILKVMDRRDLAWVLIPALSVLFLSGMYFFGFKSRYNTAIVNTASLIEIKPGSDEAYVTSAIGVFNNRRGTLTVEYDDENGIQPPFIEQDNYYYYRGETEGKVVAKFTMGDHVKLEQYDVALWTPKMLYAQQTVPFRGNILNNITIKDGRIKGIIENSTPFDLLDTVLVIGNNIVRIGDIVAWDSRELDIPFDGKDVYKQPEEYLDAMYGKTWYNTPKEYPENFQELYQKRRLFENYLNQYYNANWGRAAFTILARNEQEFDYGLTVNEKEPQKYFKNLILMDSALTFTPGQEVELPAGIVIPSMYQENDIAWYETNNSLLIRGLGDIEFEFILPGNLVVNEMRFYVENYIPLSRKYRMGLDSSGQTEVLSNKYEFYLYNMQTKTWDKIESDTTDECILDKTIKGNASHYIGSGNEVRMKVSVVEMGKLEDGVYYYNEEVITMPEIYIKGVSK